jgi:hypothetical protein
VFTPWDLIWIFFLLSSLQPVLQKYLLASARRRMLRTIAGTLIALAADEIVLDRHAALGPVDPQLGQYAANSLVEVASMPGRHEDQTLLRADIGRKALHQVDVTVRMLLANRMDAARAADVSHLLSSGVWTHDHALMAPELEQLGLTVRVGMPDEERLLMDLYPSREAGRPLSSTSRAHAFRPCCHAAATICADPAESYSSAVSLRL